MFVKIVKRSWIMVYTITEWEQFADRIFKEKDVKSVNIVVTTTNNAEIKVKLSKLDGFKYMEYET